MMSSSTITPSEVLAIDHRDHSRPPSHFLALPISPVSSYTLAIYYPLLNLPSPFSILPPFAVLSRPLADKALLSLSSLGLFFLLGLLFTVLPACRLP